MIDVGNAVQSAIEKKLPSLIENKFREMCGGLKSRLFTEVYTDGTMSPDRHLVSDIQDDDIDVSYEINGITGGQVTITFKEGLSDDVVNLLKFYFDNAKQLMFG